MQPGRLVAGQSSGSPHEAPPSDPERRAILAKADLLANLLDTTVRITGTRLYLGLDPLLGLILGIGDILANLMGTVILGLGVRLQVPQMVLARMSLNLLINGAAGAIPIFGDLFSVWFRSHARNAELLRRAASQPYRASHRDWFYVTGIIGGTAAVLILAIALVLWIVVKIWAAIAP